MTEPVLINATPEGITTITFNRPQARNALNLAAMQRFARIVRELEEDDDLSVVILTGTGDAAFCSGGDLVELSQYPSQADARNFITVMGDALLALERLPVPVIAAINGYALGGGSEIAMACDMRIIDETARMGFVQIKLALTPGWGAGQRLLRQVGYALAMEILLRGEPLHADQLLSLRLANRVVEKGTALPRALDFARHIAEMPNDVVRAVKSLLQTGCNRSYDEALQFERDLFPPLWAAEPHLNAVEAFLKRNKSQ